MVRLSLRSMEISPPTRFAGGAIYQNNGDTCPLWGNGWLAPIHEQCSKAVRFGPVALSGGLWRDFQLGGVTGGDGVPY